MYIIFLYVAEQPAVGLRASSLSRLLDHTHVDAPHSVGLLWTRDRLVAETST